MNKIYNIEDPTTIDGLGCIDEENKLVMLIIDDTDFDEEEQKHLFLLQNKLNNYIHFIETKQYMDEYPDIKEIEIRINFKYRQTENTKNFLMQVDKIINSHLDNTRLNVTYNK